MPYVTVGKENPGIIELYYEDHGSGQPSMAAPSSSSLATIVSLDSTLRDAVTKPQFLVSAPDSVAVQLKSSNLSPAF